MTDSVQGTATHVGIEEPRGHVFAVLTAITQSGPAEFPPDRLRVDADQGLVEIEFADSPAGVMAWAGVMGLPHPSNRSDTDLRQTMVEVTGSIYGWRLEIRHVHTAPATVTPRHAVPA